MFGYFIIRKLFDISCISDHVQPISKPLSVILAECGHFVVTWSVQKYSCGHLVCPEIFMWSLGLCRNIHVVTWSVAGIFLHSPVLLYGHIGVNRTKHRNRLGIATLNSLLTVQCSTKML